MEKQFRVFGLAVVLLFFTGCGGKTTSYWRWNPDLARQNDVEVKIMSLGTAKGNYVAGVNLRFRNFHTDPVRIVLNRSKIEVADVHIIPILGSSKAGEIGKPSSLQSITVRPGEKITRFIYFSKVPREQIKDDTIEAVLIPYTETKPFIVSLAVQKGDEPVFHNRYEFKLFTISSKIVDNKIKGKN